MHIVQTLYIDKDKDPFKDSFGWVAPEYHLMGWALSCLQLHALYGSVSLFANSPAVRVLIDELQLPYTNVSLSHDKLALIHPNLWALPKIYTYSIQEQPFLHVDGDVFLFKPFDTGLMDGELIAQNIEVGTEKYYLEEQKNLMRHFTFFPSCVRDDFEGKYPINACNAGILGGNNVSFLRDYAALAFEYVHKNAENIKYVNVNMFNVFFEQHLFCILAKTKGIPVSVLFRDIIPDNGYKNLGDFHDVPFNRSYLHLLGAFKKDEFTCIQMSAKLRELYPEYYERIVALFRNKKLRLSPAGFMNEPDPITTDFDEQSNSYLQRLKFVTKNCQPNVDVALFQNDFDMFYNQLISFLSTKGDMAYLHEKSLSSQCWYRDLFADDTRVLDQFVVRCPEIEVVESLFDWAGLFNKLYRVVGYYSNLQVTKGTFFNLIVPEASDNGFSLYDISELDYLLLQLLCEPLSINDILIKMQLYFGEDVLQNHYESYKKLILTTIKEFVIKKAIQPYSKCEI